MRLAVTILAVTTVQGCTRFGMPENSPDARLTEREIAVSYLFSERECFTRYLHILGNRGSEAMAAGDMQKWDQFLQAQEALVYFTDTLIPDISGSLRQTNTRFSDGVQMISYYREKFAVKPVTRLDPAWNNSFLASLFALTTDLHLYILRVVDTDGKDPEFKKLPLMRKLNTSNESSQLP